MQTVVHSAASHGGRRQQSAVNTHRYWTIPDVSKPEPSTCYRGVFKNSACFVLAAVSCEYAWVLDPPGGVETRAEHLLPFFRLRDVFFKFEFFFVYICSVLGFGIRGLGAGVWVWGCGFMIYD